MKKKISFTFSNVIIDLELLKKRTLGEIVSLINLFKIKGINRIVNKRYVLNLLIKKFIDLGIKILSSGIVDILYYRYGFLRNSRDNYNPSINDIYISANTIRESRLKTGDFVKGLITYYNEEYEYMYMYRILQINSFNIKKRIFRNKFKNLTPTYPEEKIKLELKDKFNSCKVVDIITPIGRGQRCLIVSPPRVGKTTLMNDIAYSIKCNHPEIYLIILSIGERPEEVTDMINSIEGEIISSTFDKSSYRHVQLAELAIEKAKRLVEYKKDVVILLDSITRLTRSYNDISPTSGRTLSGGINFDALKRPKKFFGSARNIREGGSLTIIATALIETGSRMDEVIFEEFKGTGNSEIVLDKKISNKRIFPAINILKSGTRKENLLIEKYQIEKVMLLKRILYSMSEISSITFLMKQLKFFRINDDFISNINSVL